MDGDILISTDQMMRAFVRWDRAYREDPKAFVSTVERIFNGTYGSDASARVSTEYFRGLLVQAR